MPALYQAFFGPLDGLTGVGAPLGGGQGLDWPRGEDTAEGIVALLKNEAMAGESADVSSSTAYAHDEIVDRASPIRAHPSAIRSPPAPSSNARRP